MSSTQETNNKSEEKNRVKRSMSRSYIAENVGDTDSDLSLDGTPRPAFQDDVQEQTESVTENEEMKRKETKTKQQTNTPMPGIDGTTEYEAFVEVSAKEDETHGEKDTSPKTKLKSKRKSNVHALDSASDEETPKRAKGKRSKSKESSSKQQLDHRGNPRRSFHDSQEEDN